MNNICANCFAQFVSISAAYLYDSVKLYAWALDKLLRQQTVPLTPDVIRNVSSDGISIIETIIQNRTYKSVTGATVKIDENGDSEGNFSVVALKQVSYTLQNKSAACDYYMVPVAYFHQGEHFPVSESPFFYLICFAFILSYWVFCLALLSLFPFCIRSIRVLWTTFFSGY